MRAAKFAKGKNVPVEHVILQSEIKAFEARISRFIFTLTIPHARAFRRNSGRFFLLYVGFGRRCSGVREVTSRGRPGRGQA